MSRIHTAEIIQDVVNKLHLNYKETQQFISDVNNDKGERWLEKIEELHDGILLANYKALINYVEPDKDECEDEDEDYPEEELYYVYDKDDDCVSNEFKYESDAIKWAKKHKYPIVKVHRYYRDPTRGYKLYPDGGPEVVYESGKPI